MIFRFGSKTYSLTDKQAARLIVLLVNEGDHTAAKSVAEQWIRQRSGPPAKRKSLFASALGLADDALAIAGVVSLFDKD